MGRRDRKPIRVLLLADTHLGYDMPQRPRIERRRRGHDFFANFATILETAVEERVDCVVHGGDLFFRSRIPASLVQQAFLPIKRVADSGIPFLIVPGNHERSRIPYELLALHPGIHIFDRPRTFNLNLNGRTVGFAGFPYFRDGVRGEFLQLLETTNWQAEPADLRFLCVHHCFEGATVGAHNYMFRYGRDVISPREVPSGFVAVLTGHIHRFQVLKKDMRGRALETPVMYPGSIERTAFAERLEEKGYLLIEVESYGASGPQRLSWEFRPLPTRPMFVKELDASVLRSRHPEESVRDMLDRLPDDAVVQIRVNTKPEGRAAEVLRAPVLRTLAPPTMNVEVVMRA